MLLRRSWLFVFVAFGIAGPLTVANRQVVIYVDDDAPLGGDGTSWTTAYRYLQDALFVATSGDEIRVAAGIYKPDRDEAGHVSPGDRTATFQLISGVSIYGGYAGLAQPGDPNPRHVEAFETLLSGDLNGDDGPLFVGQFAACYSGEYAPLATGCEAFDLDEDGHVDSYDQLAFLDANHYGDNSYHVLTGSDADHTAILDGFIVAAGNADDFTQEKDASGGGMYNAYGRPTLANCTFSGNTALSHGGAMENTGQSNPTLTKCALSGNFAWIGGGMSTYSASNPLLTDCTFIDNAADEGGGMFNLHSSPSLTDCTFSANVAGRGGGMYNVVSSPTVVNGTFSENKSDDGGGMYNEVSSDPMLTGCIFSGNSAGTEGYSEGVGGGMANFSSSPSLTDCTFVGNTASPDGGGMANAGGSPSLTECKFIGNSANVRGGAMSNTGSDPTLDGCTFHRNTSSAYGGALYNYESDPTLIGCSFNDNTATDQGGGMYNFESSPTLSDCAFAWNTASSRGGGMYNISLSSPTLTDCLFRGNVTYGEYGGGGAIANSVHCAPILTDCTFADNVAGYGGGMHNVGAGPTVRNCAFADNIADFGGGLLNGISGSITLSNCTFCGNWANDDGGGVYNWSGSSTLVDCVLWGNSDSGGADESAQIYVDGGTIVVTYSLIQGLDTFASGAGNIDGDPLFVPGPAGCYYLSQTAAGQAADSPCVDAGSETAGNLGLDTMTTRADEGVDAGTVDMGYHYPVTAQPLIMGDFDRNGDVNLPDFAGLQGCFTNRGPLDVAPCCRIFDFEPDGDVDLDDYADFLTAFTTRQGGAHPMVFSREQASRQACCSRAHGWATGFR